PLRHDPPVGYHRQTVDRLLGFEDVVGHENHPDPHLAQPADLIPQEPAAQGVDVVRRLVEDHEATGYHRHHHEPDEAADATREPGTQGVPPFLRLGRFHQLAGPGVGPAPVTSADPP